MAGAGIQSLAPCSNVYRGLWQPAEFRPRIATNKITVLRIDTDRSINLRADCHRPDLTACIPGNLSKELSNPQSLESGLPRDIPVVAICGIWLRNLSNERIPVPTIFHWLFPCLLHYKFLTRDFLGVRQICGGLFRPKLYTNGLLVDRPSRNTIPLT
jgi:hypothetical protein